MNNTGEKKFFLIFEKIFRQVVFCIIGAKRGKLSGMSEKTYPSILLVGDGCVDEVKSVLADNLPTLKHLFVVG